MIPVQTPDPRRTCIWYALSVMFPRKKSVVAFSMILSENPVISLNALARVFDS